MVNCGLAPRQQTPRFDLKTVRLMDAVPTAYNCSSVCGDEENRHWLSTTDRKCWLL